MQEWALSPDERKGLGEAIKNAEFSWPIGMPLVRPLGREFYEVRSNLPGGRIGRFDSARFCSVGAGRPKTPPHEIDLALKRKRGVDGCPAKRAFVKKSQGLLSNARRRWRGECKPSQAALGRLA